MSEDELKLMCNIIPNKFSPKVHKILEILLDDPLLTDILFDIIDDDKSFPLKFRLKRFSEYMFMTRPSWHPNEIIEALKARSESPIEVNQLTNKDN
jgi:hypothetical protein